MNCKYCHTKCQKAGRQSNGAQKLYCTGCRKYQQSDYRYAGCRANILSIIPKLICESVGIRGIARILKISTSTVIRKIKWIAGRIAKPPIPFQRTVFELDELRTYIKQKENEYRVAYAICGETKQVVDFTVGKRSKRVLGSIVHTYFSNRPDKTKTALTGAVFSRV